MDVAARYGGDEFVLLLPHTNGDEAQRVAERIREQFFAASAGLLKREPGVTMSVGIGSLKTNRPVGADQLVALADAALYSAKDAGRNRINLSDGPRTAAA
jgi:diguanylate cyclase (GGDEF)-like protein